MADTARPLGPSDTELLQLGSDIVAAYVTVSYTHLTLPTKRIV